MNTHLKRFLLLGGVIMLPLPAYAATTRTVGSGTCGGSACQYSTIQAAIDASTSGDSIRVWPGIYNENLVIDSADATGLTIVHAPAVSGEVVVNGGGTAPVLTVRDQGSGLTVSGLTLTNGKGADGSTVGLTSGKFYGGGVLLIDSSPVLEDMLIQANTATFGAGLFLMRASPTIRWSVINDNTGPGGYGTTTAASGGAGIYLHQDSEPTLEYCNITGNYGVLRGGGIYAFTAGSPQLIGVRIANNQAGYGGGLYLSTAASPLITGSAIVGNSAFASSTSVTPPGGGGIYLYDGAAPYLVNVLLANNSNSNSNDGVDLYSYGGSPRFLNSIISNASASSSATLLYGKDITDLSLTGRPANAGLELHYSDLCKGAASCVSLPSSPAEYLGGSYTSTNVMAMDVLNAFPDFTNPDFDDFTLKSTSALKDAGSPDEQYKDPDLSRADMGAYGGPLPLVVNASASYNDSDGDGMTDDWETAFFGNYTSHDGTADGDGDALTDLDEYLAGTDPVRPDTDRDGFKDGFEATDAASDPLDPTDHKPVADIGRDRIGLVGEPVALEAGLTYDPDGTALSYAWTMSVPGGSAAALSSSSGGATSFTPDVTGVYEITMTVTDTMAGQASSAASSSRTIRVYVGDEVTVSSGSSIQAAISSAVSDRTITVASGSYNETLDFQGKRIRVRAGTDNGAHIIAPSSGPAAKFVNGEPEAASLEGFTLQGGTGVTLAMSSGSYTAGGGVYIQSASPSLRNLTITGNTAGFGGGVAIVSGSPLLEALTITSNTAGTAGGGVYAYGGAPVIRSSSIGSNAKTVASSGIQGGGVYAYGSSLTLVGTGSAHGTVSSNAAVDGGGLFLYRCDRAVLRNVDVASNSASGNGAGLYVTDRGGVRLAHVALTSNQATGGTSQGGAAFISSAALVSMIDSTVGGSSAGNSAAYGGAFALAGTSTIQDTASSIAYNTASQHGGVLYSLATWSAGVPESRFSGSIIDHNSATAGEGGVLYLGSGSRVTLIKAKVTSNSAGTNGGVVAVHNPYDKVTVKNCLLVANSGATGGAAYATASGTVTMTNDTMVANSATTGAAIATVGAGIIRVTNSIIAHSPSGYAVSSAGNVSITFSTLYNPNASGVTGFLADGSSYLSSDPAFTRYDSSAPTAATNDFHLYSGSAAINAGDPDTAMNDLNGSRNDLGHYGGPDGENYTPGQDGDSDSMPDDWEIANFGSTSASAGGSADQDADGLTDVNEYLAGTDPNVADTDGDGISDGTEVTNNQNPLDASDNRPVARAGRDRAVALGMVARLDGSRSSDPNRDALTYAWKLTSVPAGSALDTVNNFSTSVRGSFTPDVAGDYVAGLTVNDGHTDSALSSVTIHVPAAVITVGTDYATLQEAINAAPAWSVIVVPPGTYNEQLTFGTTPMTVMSTSGPGVTIIQPTTATSSVVYFNGSPETVVLSGFTLAGGVGRTFYANVAGGGVYMNGASAVIEGCVIRDNSAYKGAGVMVVGGAPMLINNHIIGNSATGGGGGVWLDGASALLENNVIAKNSAPYGAGLFGYYSTAKVLFNTFAGGSATVGGAVYLGGSTANEIRNNIIANSVSGGGMFAGSGNTVESNLFAANTGYNSMGFTLPVSNVTASSPGFVAYNTSASASALMDDFRLATGSAAIDAGSSDVYYYRDPAGAASATPDMGAAGGPLAILHRISYVKTPATTGYYSSIASAITASISGDIVKVLGGTFAERVSFGGKNISIIGAADGIETILDGGAAGSVVSATGGETSAAVLSRVTVQNGAGTLNTTDRRLYGGGIYIKDSSPTISQVLVKANSADVGAGIYLNNSGSMLENLTVKSNTANILGGGIALYNSGSAIVSNSVVAFNAAGSSSTSAQGGGIHVSGSGATLTNLLIQENSTSGWGGGVLSYNSPMHLVNSVIVGNSAASNQGGGVFMIYSTPELRNSIVAQNASYGLIAYASATPTVQYNDFYGNSQQQWLFFGTGYTLSNNQYVDPKFMLYTKDGTEGTADDFHLQSGSALRDAGDASASYDDPDGSRNDLGIYGGPDGSSW